MPPGEVGFLSEGNPVLRAHPEGGTQEPSAGQNAPPTKMGIAPDRDRAPRFSRTCELFFRIRRSLRRGRGTPHGQIKAQSPGGEEGVQAPACLDRSRGRGIRAPQEENVRATRVMAGRLGPPFPSVLRCQRPCDRRRTPAGNRREMEARRPVLTQAGPRPAELDATGEGDLRHRRGPSEVGRVDRFPARGGDDRPQGAGGLGHGARGHSLRAAWSARPLA